MAQQILFMQKMSARSIPNYSVNLIRFEETRIFEAPFARILTWHILTWDMANYNFMYLFCTQENLVLKMTPFQKYFDNESFLLNSVNTKFKTGHAHGVQ